MIKFLCKLYNRLTNKEVVHFIPHLPVGLELSDGDRAALYGWPNKTISEVTQYE